MPTQRLKTVKGRLIAQLDSLMAEPLPLLLHQLESDPVNLFGVSTENAIETTEAHVNDDFLAAGGNGSWWGDSDKTPYMVAAYRKALELCFLNADGTARVDPHDASQADMTGRPVQSLWIRGLKDDDFGMSVVDFGAFVCVIWLTPEVPGEIDMPVPDQEPGDETLFDPIWAVEDGEMIEVVTAQFVDKHYTGIPENVTEYDNCPGVKVFQTVRY